MILGSEKEKRLAGLKREKGRLASLPESEQITMANSKEEK